MRVSNATNDITVEELENATFIWHGEQPAPTDETIAQMWPAYARAIVSTSKSALAAAVREAAQLVYDATGFALTRFSSPRAADTEEALEYWGDRRKLARGAGEPAGKYRERLAQSSDRITPNAFRAMLHELAQQDGTLDPLALEPADDGMFCQDVARVADDDWACFAQSTTSRIWAYDPERPDKRWGAYAFGTLQPTVSFSEIAGRRGKPEFWIYLPYDGDTDPEAYAVATTNTAPDDSDYLGTTSQDNAFAFGSQDALVDRIMVQVEAMRAAGVPYGIMLDTLIPEGK